MAMDGTNKKERFYILDGNSVEISDAVFVSVIFFFISHLIHVSVCIIFGFVHFFVSLCLCVGCLSTCSTGSANYTYYCQFLCNKVLRRDAEKRLTNKFQRSRWNAQWVFHHFCRSKQFQCLFRIANKWSENLWFIWTFFKSFLMRLIN